MLTVYRSVITSCLLSNWSDQKQAINWRFNCEMHLGIQKWFMMIERKLSKSVFLLVSSQPKISTFPVNMRELTLFFLQRCDQFFQLWLLYFGFWQASCLDLWSHSIMLYFRHYVRCPGNSICSHMVTGAVFRVRQYCWELDSVTFFKACFSWTYFGCFSFHAVEQRAAILEFLQ